MNYWLMKSEPDVFSIDDLARKKREPWNGVRNYLARNHMRAMNVGDLVLFYHSNAEVIGVAGIMEVVKAAYPDPTQFDKKSEYFDPKSSLENPRWDLVDVGFKEKFKEVVTLETLKANPALDGLILLQKGTRLSVIPVSAAHYRLIVKLAK
jgi:predicted RNA-binding protein with PUA-like domain